MKITTKKIVFGAMVAAVYAALTMLLAPISYGPLQFRVSEALCILPWFFPWSSWGLFFGCVIANLISAAGPLDVIFGSLATLGAALCTAFIGRKNKDSLGRQIAGCFMPVIWNAVIVGAVLAWTGSANHDAFVMSWAIIGLEVGVGELAVMYVIGLPLIRLLPRTKVWAGIKKLVQ